MYKKNCYIEIGFLKKKMLNNWMKFDFKVNFFVKVIFFMKVLFNIEEVRRC